MHSQLLRFCVLAVGAPFVVVGCGGGSGSPSASAAGNTTTSSAPTANNQSALRSCMQKRGVDLPAGFGQGGPPGGGPGGSGPTPGSLPQGGAPGSAPGGVDQQKLQAAIKACGGTAGGFGGAGAGGSQAFAAYLSCLVDHGVSVPTSTTGTSAGPGALNAVRNDPKFAAANKACQALLPTAGATTTTTSG
jgi:hypothetical protein